MFRFLLGFAVTLFVLTATGCGDGHGSNIPIGGIGGDGGTGGVAHCAVICDGDDVCGVAGVEECCTDCEVCHDSSTDLCVLDGELCWRGQYINGNWKYVQVECEINECDPDRYEEGFRDGVDSVVCEVDDDVEDECNADVPRGHLRKECRGNPND